MSRISLCARTPESALKKVPSHLSCTSAGSGSTTLCPSLLASSYPEPSEPETEAAFPPVARIKRSYDSSSLWDRSKALFGHFRSRLSCPCSARSYCTTLTTPPDSPGLTAVTSQSVRICTPSLSHALRSTSSTIDACSDAGYTPPSRFSLVYSPRLSKKSLVLPASNLTSVS